MKDESCGHTMRARVPEFDYAFLAVKLKMMVSGGAYRGMERRLTQRIKVNIRARWESPRTRRYGTVTDISDRVDERLFASDLAFLQDLYRRINQEGHTRAAVTCPSCSHEFAVDVAGERLGES